MSTATPGPRIALIHATALSIEPVNAALARHWPQAQCMHLLDGSLSVDRARDGRLTDEMTQRFVDLASYAKRTGAKAILFTCSAFGPAIEAAGRAVGIAALKPNEAMFEEALGLRQAQAERGKTLKLGLIATFPASIPSMSGELQSMARERGIAIDLRTMLVDGAMDDLAQGRADEHHRKIAEAARQMHDCDAVMLAQFSMAAAREHVQRELQCPVMSSPDCAVLALRQRMPDA